MDITKTIASQQHHLGEDLGGKPSKVNERYEPATDAMFASLSRAGFKSIFKLQIQFFEREGILLQNRQSTINKMSGLTYSLLGSNVDVKTLSADEKGKIEFGSVMEDFPFTSLQNL